MVINLTIGAVQLSSDAKKSLMKILNGEDHQLEIFRN